MRKTACVKCASETPLGETYSVFGNNPLCEPCANEDLAGRDLNKLAPGTVVRNTDPTICSRCGTDWGSGDLETAGRAPLCSQCLAFVRKYPFPAWIKIAAAAVVALVALAFVLNARYFQAFLEIRAAGRLLEARKLDEAAATMSAAAARVPGSSDLASVASFYRGISLLSHDKSLEAEKALMAAQPVFGSEPGFQRVLLSARIGASFDRRDYDTFLQRALELMKLEPQSSQVVAGVASAYACKYAVTGSEEFKVASLDYLERARKLARPEDDYEEYAARIRHRLESREILTRDQYQKRFGTPKGAAQ